MGDKFIELSVCNQYASLYADIDIELISPGKIFTFSDRYTIRPFNMEKYREQLISNYVESTDSSKMTIKLRYKLETTYFVLSDGPVNLYEIINNSPTVFIVYCDPKYDVLFLSNDMSVRN